VRRRLPGPAIASNRLRAQLIRYRENAGLLQTDVIRALDWSPSKIHRVENGPSRVQTGDVILLLQVYGIDDPTERDRLIELARASRMPGISTRYKKVFSPEFLEYLDYEAFADRIMDYETKFIPGVLQIGGYAEAVNRTVTHDDEEIILRTDARNERAQNLLDPEGPEFEFIIDEAALHRAFGSTEYPWSAKFETMERLIDNLKRLNTAAIKEADDVSALRVNPNISIRIVPFEWEVYKAYYGPFVLLEFNDPDDRPVLYLEYPDSEKLVFEEREIERYRQMFEELRESIPGPEDTNELLDFIRESYAERLSRSPFRPNRPAP
jgi:transcriptional regulator with XRE-family HTH domain